MRSISRNQRRLIRAGDSLPKLVAILLAAFSMLSAGPARAGDPRFGDTLTFSFGGMKHTGDGFVASTRPNLPLDRVTFTDLDLNDDDDILWANLNWNFSNRWQFGFSYSSFDSKGLEVATTSGNFEGVDWEVGAVLSSSLDVDFYIVDFSYDILRKENGYLGAGFGVHAADIDFDLFVGVFGSAGGGDVEFVPVSATESSFLAPLPNLSLVGGYTFADKVYVEGRTNWLSLSYDEYDGKLLTLRLSAEWRPWERVGIGAGYQFVDVDVRRKGSRGKEFYDLEFDGPILFMSVGF